jgi:hypothetical protein
MLAEALLLSAAVLLLHTATAQQSSCPPGSTSSASIAVVGDPCGGDTVHISAGVRQLPAAHSVRR